MGPHYAHTLFYYYLASPKNHPIQIDLKYQPIIIDANSFMYFIYYQMSKDHKFKNQNQSLTSIPFGYDAYWKFLRQTLTTFKNKCSYVRVVFDGIFKRNTNRRPDPERTSSIRFIEFNASQNQLPSLFRRGFIDNLRELNIDITVARGEADPMIARLAQDHNAYVVAADTDYHLYDLPRGYVPLKFLNLQRLKGPLYRMNDIFSAMDSRGVALWASLVTYAFVTLSDLQKFLSTTQFDDRNEFESWLNSEEPDEQKQQLLTTEWSLLRFIQQVGSEIAYQQLIRLVSLDDRNKFDQIRFSYINVVPLASIKTKTGKYLPNYLDSLFITANLDHAILNILISRNILKSKKENNPVYLKLLLPIIQILLIWDNSNTEMNNDIQKVTFNYQPYEPLTEINAQDLPSLDEISNMSLVDRKKWFLYCVKSTLQSSINMNEDGIHDNHLAWMYLLKLWWYKGQEQTLLKKSVLYAMIVSYLIHTLLDLDDESENSGRSTKQTSISEPFLQYSTKKLKKRFSSDICFFLNQKINNYAMINVDDENIKNNLYEAEQFYNVFYMVNQFFHLPIIMPKPRECISTLAYHLAIAFTKSKKPDADIQKSLFRNNEILIGLFDEIKSWIEQIHQPTLVVNEDLST